PGGPMHFAYLKVPETLPRFVKLVEGSGFVAVEDVVRANLRLVYPGRFVEEAYAFRVTRGADLELDEHHAVSLLQVIEEETKRRPYGAAVRVEIAGDMPEAVRELLLRELQFEEAAASSPPGAGDLYAADGLLDLGALRELARLPLPEADYPPHRGGAPLEEGWSSSRPTPRRRSSCAASGTASGATCISGPGTTTPRRRPSTPMWDSCRRTRNSGRT